MVPSRWNKFSFSRLKFRMQTLAWIFPLFALVLSVWILKDFWTERGALIEIRFPDAANIEEQRTQVKYRGINVGRVEEVDLSEDGRQVVVLVRMQRTARKLAVEGSRFQLIEPQVSLDGIQGLETLIKGVYIDLEPGKPDAPQKLKFVGQPNSVVNNEPGVTFVLRSRFLDGVSDGAPLIYRGIRVGQVQEVRLNPEAQWVETRVRLEQKYRHLVRANTSFWVKKAVQADVGLLGASLELASIEGMMKGGISMATPAPAGKLAPPGAPFLLQEEEPKNWKEWNPNLGNKPSLAGK